MTSGIRHRSSAVDLERVGRLHQHGVGLNNAGRPVEALRLFKRALAVLDGVAVSPAEAEPVRMRIQISAAMSESELGGLARGLQALNDVKGYVDRSGDREIEVLLRCQLGFMQVRGGHFSEGRNHLDAAVELLSHTTPAQSCNILINRGMVSVYLGDLARARVDYLRAADVAHRDGLVVEQAKARHNLGEVEFLAGNLAAALDLMDQAARLDADVSEAVSLVDRARVLLEAGLYRDADEALLEAWELFRRDRLWKDVGEVELARAECALLEGEVETARRLAARARERFRKRGNDSWRRSATLVLLQADLAAGRAGTRLARPAQDLVEEFLSIGLVDQARTAQLIAAEALLDAGRTEEAARVAARLAAGRAEPISTRLQRRYVQARLEISVGRRAAGRRQVRVGLEELSSYQARFGSIDLQTASAVHGRRLAQLDLDLALADGRAMAVLEALERGRASSNRLTPVEPPSDPQTAELLTHLRRAVESLREVESDSRAATRVAAIRAQVADIQRSLRARSWHAHGSGAASRPARLTQVRIAVAERGIVMACLLEAGGELHAVRERGAQPATLHRLGPVAPVLETARRVRADLDVLASGRLPQAMATAVMASLRRALSFLDDRLLRPLNIADAPLLVIPTGELATLAWGALPSLRGRPVVVAPSATAWLAAAGSPYGRGKPAVAVFAGPGLGRANEEAGEVARLWPSARVLTNQHAGQAELVRAISDCDVVHVAAHGRHQPENPLFSAIQLADGPVFAYEFDQSARAAPHVILSACELGQATLRPGDEALGLTSVLLHLGSRSVISGVAKVRDDVAAEVMVRYHAGLAAGRDSARALADATAAVDGPPAPFVCFGSSWRTAAA